MTQFEPLACEAILTWADARPVFCSRVVGIRGYWAIRGPFEVSDHFVTYCAIDGHRSGLERRFPPRIDLPEFPDAIDQAKWTHDRDGWPA